MTNPRQVAFIALKEVHKGAYADVALDRALQKFKLPDSDNETLRRDRRLTTELVYGCVRRQRTLDTLIDQIATKKAQQQPPDLRTILHLGFYQLRYQEKIPPSAAVNTTVELAKANGLTGLTGFINGLLRQYLRLGEKSSEPLKLPENSVERLGILYSFPDWIIEVWLAQLGFAETEKLCAWMNQTPTIDLRVNILRSSLKEVESAFQSAGVLVKRIPRLPQALRLIGSNGPIQNLPGFREGWWTIQDSSAQLVGHLLDPKPGEVVIDACAAPGGKTTHIAELMGDHGKIWACDKTASRLRKLQDNARRLNLQSIEIYTGDSCNLPQFYNQADRVLLDAPCSGLGTMHRHADARWRQTPESIQQLSLLQTKLLSHTSNFVKDNGVLVYATCTLHPAENEEVISRFLADHPHWQVEPPRQNLTATSSTPPGWLKIWPHQEDMDGFFMVRLRKTNNSE
ncbi:16S rRNA (cytosine(967)-C(5))-methyltransferase [Anabaena cylindrica FACHB-243]|uniref:16S rRNA (cytosine(967)-C(5))-methyltransferase n=1 Tax=Anabaena cylindrica (strain ATCC 27899 / PCC 7122) TaxID=272123 RepID=K9ZLS8_ANACC|nr:MULTISPECIES: 16S rRNA (cytosine(967)-C(5))-methyltransferase [Anabaena]AFZ59739.1 sun protein [Anabaena cylindrica PCC 7122]MBD2417144.1 16S rRNA (cytosine(967)-C(5))-methyltransferase [Anabaena cylindrica FACHB-243]MBY5285179.1 16S rRNA (cytosine(967)-C(5))-methyltransferase [Anabaena sp. CCAP 1446/1C]MBY5307885.1 16S rRNA (cytosine(967)-C(5))-methyltransferase [Anabaena sp. CCAP 1446/1C]MCM2405040.1 16S rRNA (cytosine(967)-C(5))-methyltransferase [Anabaena sp. CCAP 1446/1C]